MNWVAAHWRSNSSRFAYVVLVGFVAVGFAIVQNRHTGEPPHARRILGPYPTQKVHNRVPGIPGPAMRVGDVTNITGVLCNRTRRPVPVLTTISWRAIDHAGTAVTVATAIHQTRKPGCEPLRFRNPMGSEIVKAARTVGTARWVVEGFEIPDLPGPQLEEKFSSEPFQIVVGTNL